MLHMGRGPLFLCDVTVYASTGIKIKDVVTL